MDPNVALKEIRKILAASDGDVIERLADLISELDGWMSAGGRLPDDWQAKR